MNNLNKAGRPIVMLSGAIYTASSAVIMMKDDKLLGVVGYATAGLLALFAFEQIVADLEG